MSKRSFQLSMVLAALMVSILACSFSFSSAKVENVRLVRDKEGSQATTQFNPQDTFYLVGNMTNAPDDTLLKAVWTAVKAEGATDNTVIKEVEATGGNGDFRFELAQENGNWPRGQYKVDLYMNDELNQTLNFDVVGPEPTPTPAPAALETAPVEPIVNEPIATEAVVAPAGQVSISNLHTAKDDADTQPAVAFAQADIMYAHFNLEASDGQADVYGVLIAVAVEGLQAESVFTDINETLSSGANWISFSNTNPWPIGRYRIDVTANGTALQSVNIEVVNTNTSGARIENVYASLDLDGTQPSTAFSPDGAIYIQFTLVGAPPDTAIKGVMIAREVAGLEPDTLATEAGEQLGDGSYQFTFTNQGPWPTGQYVVFVYVNGQFVQQVDVEVSG
jgi:outer membrane usher protein FimD/PapC